jgi:hypothetical protein
VGVMPCKICLEFNRLNSMLNLTKSHKIGPKVLTHWTPNTISQPPKVKT